VTANGANQVIGGPGNKVKAKMSGQGMVVDCGITKGIGRPTNTYTVEYIVVRECGRKM
jgi:hypothetical protein